MPAKVIWDPSTTPYPAARRDESASETYKSEEKGEVVVKEPYGWLHEVRTRTIASRRQELMCDCRAASEQE
jgi:hypothetical protein